MKTIARLLGGGMSFAEIDALDDVEMLAWSIAFGENLGGEFDFDRMAWADKSS
jgi:hypothetical protein